MRKQTEHDIYLQIADYMRLHYPEVIYRFDLAADLKLTMGQASKHKRLQRFRGYPDLFIAQPSPAKMENFGKESKYTPPYAGLFIEIKKPGTKIYKKDGTLVADAHIREQFDMLLQLSQAGYQAHFGIGFDDCVKIISDYLSE